MVVRFRNNLMTDEGYLMFTLPVSVHQLLWSKLLVSMLWFIAVFCVDALALVLTVYEDGMFAGLPEFVRTLFDSGSIWSTARSTCLSCSACCWSRW